MTFKTKPMKHQAEALLWGMDKNRTMFWMDIGTGKTLVGLYLAKLWGCRKILVVCPSCVRSTWVDETRKHTEWLPNLADGTREERLRVLDGADISVLNYEGLKIVMGVKIVVQDGDHTRGRYVPLLPKDMPGFDCVIFDEIHHLKNPRALQTKIAMRFASRIPKVIMLTGTPIATDERDLWAEFYVLDGGKSFGTSFHAFLQKYFKMTFFDWKIKKGARSEILDCVKETIFRKHRSECVDLPPRTYERRVYHLTDEQQEATDNLMENLVAEFREGKLTLSNVLVRTVKLPQIVGGFLIMDNGVHHFEPNPKLDELVALLKEVDEKCIVFHRFQEEGRLIEGALKKAGIKFIAIRGEISNTSRGLGLTAFRNDPDVKVLITNPVCGGEGLNLQEASVAIFYSNDYTIRDQAEGRIWRIGQKRPCLFVDLVAEGTIDETILKVVRTKTDSAEGILDYVRRYNS